MVGGSGGGGPKGWVPEVVWARRVGAQNFALFFLSPAGNFILSSLSGGLLVAFWWFLKRRDAHMCAFGVLWLSCEAAAARSGGAAGVSHNSPRTPNAHISVLRRGRSRGGGAPTEGGLGVQRRGPKNLEDTHQKS